MNNGFADNNTSAINDTSMIQRIDALEQELRKIRDELDHQRTINRKLMEYLNLHQSMHVNTDDDRLFIYKALLTIYDVATKTRANGYAVQRLIDELRKRV